MKIVNAQITNTFLGIDDHRVMTFYIYIRLQGGSCGIGGYSLQEYNEQQEKITYSDKGLDAIKQILDVVGVDSWEELKGKYIRVKDNGWGESIDEIGNLIENKWFNLRKFFQEKK